jgi:Tfp pilus assembly protein PilP
MFIALAGAAVHAPGPSPAPGAAAAQAPNASAPAGSGGQAALPHDYTYESNGRRDPFVNLLGTGTEPHSNARRGDGAAGLAVEELSVRGVLQSRTSLVAMVAGPDKRTYIVHAGDKLADGTIKAVTPQGLTILQDVNDPLSQVKQREVRKLLRSLEDARE